MTLHEFAQALEKANTTKQAEMVLRDYLLGFGFRSYAVTFYSGHVKTGSKLRYHFVSNALRTWHLHYLEQNYADVDRTLEEFSEMTLPLFWDVQQQILAAKNNREKRIREESIEFGIDKGLSIPVHGTNQELVSLALHQRKGEICLKDYQQKQYEWLSATHLFYHHIKRILVLKQKSTANYQLTKREEECLILTAKMWRVEKIAKALKISERTVNFHIQNANKKIGTNNKYQTVYKYLKFIDDEFRDNEFKDDAI